MNKKRVSIFILILFLLSLGLLFLIQKISRPTSLGNTWVINATPPKTITLDGKTIDVTLAKTNAQLAKGLGGVTKMAANEGMLFVLPTPNSHTPFWMKDMIIPIDIIWINDEKVVQIDKSIAAPTKGTSDSDLHLYIPNDPVDYVLEVNAGFSDANKIKVGTIVDLSGI